MQLRDIISSLLIATAASAQLLTKGNGNLPSCAQSCSVLTSAQSTCNGGSSTSLTAWSCFCQTVWKGSNGALTTMCASSCTSATDNAAIDSWYTANCGSDNGASEHGGGSGTNAGNNGGSAPSASASATSAANSGSDDGAFAPTCADWWSCHWKWVIMIIVVAVVLLALGFGGRWLKKRHDRKADRISSSFNAGITSHSTPMGAAGSRVNESQLSGIGDGRNSPSRTRENFMPYGYGYTRSGSRLGSANGALRGGSPSILISHSDLSPSSPLARGSSPATDLEKAAATPQKSRRVKVRERLMGESEK